VVAVASAASADDGEWMRGGARERALPRLTVFVRSNCARVRARHGALTPCAGHGVLTPCAGRPRPVR